MQYTAWAREAHWGSSTEAIRKATTASSASCSLDRAVPSRNQPAPLTPLSHAPAQTKTFTTGLSKEAVPSNQKHTTVSDQAVRANGLVWGDDLSRALEKAKLHPALPSS